MSQLASLRRKIAQLRRRRALVRAGVGLATLVLIVIATMLVAFAIDWWWGLSRSGRVVLQLCSLAVIVWAAIKHAMPWFRTQETDLDLALMLERQHRIDSDLVAALQFESPDAKRWGSPQLEQAVIDYVADFSRDWNVLEGFSARDLVRRLGYLATVLAILTPMAIARFDVTNAFFQRMLLSRTHYPTRTQIAALSINNQPVDPRADGAAVVKIPFGKPLRVAVTAEGQLPARGEVRFTATTGNGAGQFELAPSQPNQFAGALSKLVEPIRLEAFLGDARTDRVSVQLVPLPVVELQVATTPPAYARLADTTADAVGNQRTISVLEGSRAEVAVREVRKPLSKVTLLIDDVAFPMQKAAELPSNSNGANGTAVWRVAEGPSPLHNIRQALRYEVIAVDEDGLRPELSLTGSIRLKTDNLPRINGDVVTRFVLPTAAPQIEYRVSDDFGIAQLSLLLEVLRGDRGMVMPVFSEVRQLRDIPVNGWLGRDDLPLADRYRLELSSLSLQLGDQVRITLQATDYRGDQPGQTAQSEPLILEVTDESGILAAISEADERSAQQLDAIIERQLGVGGSQ